MCRQPRSFLFKFRAEKAGTYRGDIDVCEGSRFITTVAETVVTPVAHAPPREEAPAAP